MTDTNQQNRSNGELDRPLKFTEALAQSFSLIFAVQNKAGRKRLMDLAEHNPLPVIFAGVTSMIIFFLFCFITSQFFIYWLT